MRCLSLLRCLVLLGVGSCTLTPGDNSQESSQCSPWSGWGEEVEWDFLQLPIAHIPRHFIQPFLFYRSGIMVRSFSMEPHLLCGPASPKLHLDSKAQVPSALVPSFPGFLSLTFTARVLTQERGRFSPPFSWSHTHSSLITSPPLIGKLLPPKGRNLALHLVSFSLLFYALYPLLQVLGSDGSRMATTICSFHMLVPMWSSQSLIKRWNLGELVMCSDNKVQWQWHWITFKLSHKRWCKFCLVHWNIHVLGIPSYSGQKPSHVRSPYVGALIFSSSQLY